MHVYNEHRLKTIKTEIRVLIFINSIFYSPYQAAKRNTMYVYEFNLPCNLSNSFIAPFRIQFWKLYDRKLFGRKLFGRIPPFSHGDEQASFLEIFSKSNLNNVGIESETSISRKYYRQNTIAYWLTQLDNNSQFYSRSPKEAN